MCSPAFVRRFPCENRLGPVKWCQSQRILGGDGGGRKAFGVDLLLIRLGGDGIEVEADWFGPPVKSHSLPPFTAAVKLLHISVELLQCCGGEAWLQGKERKRLVLLFVDW